MRLVKLQTGDGRDEQDQPVEGYRSLDSVEVVAKLRLPTVTGIPSLTQFSVWPNSADG